MSIPIDQMASELLEVYNNNAEELDQAVQVEIDKLSGLIDKDGALTILYREAFPPEQVNEKSTQDTPFLTQFEPLCQSLVNSSTVRRAVREKAPKTSAGYLKTFKFGVKTEEAKPNYEFSGNNQSAYVFIIGNRTVVGREGEPLKIINCLIFTETEHSGFFNPPIMYSMFETWWLKEMFNERNYYKLYHVKYEGLKKSQKDSSKKYHSGSMRLVKQLRKQTQQTLKV